MSGPRDALADAVATRTGQRPQVMEAGSAQPAGQLIVVGAQTTPELASAKPESAEAITFMPFATANGQRSLAVVGGSRLGDAYGMYRLADEMLAGADDAALFSQQRTFEPAMRRRLVDLGGVGIPQDPARWDPTNYSHHLRAFEDVFLPEAPYIDPVKFAEVQAQFADYVQRMIAYGNNGIVMPGFPGVRQLRQGRRWVRDLSGRQRVPRPPPGAARRLQPAHRLRPRDGDGRLPEHRHAGLDAAAGGVSEGAVRRAGHRKPRLVAGLWQRPGGVGGDHAGRLRFDDSHRRGRDDLQSAGLGLLQRAGGALGGFCPSHAQDISGRCREEKTSRSSSAPGPWAWARWATCTPIRRATTSCWPASTRPT